MAITYRGDIGFARYAGPGVDTLTINSAITLNSRDFVVVGISTDRFFGDEDGDVVSWDNIVSRTQVSGFGIKWIKLIERKLTVGSSAGNGIVSALWYGQIEDSVSVGDELVLQLDDVNGHIIFSAAAFRVDPGNAMRVDTSVPDNPDLISVWLAFGYQTQTLTTDSAKERLFFRSITKELSTTNALVVTDGFQLGWDLRSAPNEETASSNIVGKAEFLITSNPSATSHPTGSGTASNTIGIFVAFDEYPLLSRDPEARAPTLPDENITETWKWNTLITTSWNATEQRIRQMPGPIRSAEFNYPLNYDGDVIDWQTKLRRSAINSFDVPYYQYGTPLLRDAIATSHWVFFNPSMTQIGVGYKVLIWNRVNQEIEKFYTTIESLTTEGATLVDPLPYGVNGDWSICPVFESYVRTPQYQLNSTTGDLPLSTEVIDRTRPLSINGGGSLSYYLGLPLVPTPILSDMTQRYVADTEDFETNFGARLLVSSWSYSKVERAVRFMARNRPGYNELENWLTFFDEVAGAHKAFFLPSQVRDLRLYEDYSNGDTSITLLYNRMTDYWGDPAYKYFALLFSDGVTRYYEIMSVTIVGENDLVELDRALPDDLTIEKISFLYRVRMATDVVTVKHLNNRIYFSFAVRSTEQ